ncbi:hypothetical protein Tco_0161618 [Tanacetum coccineum]
MIRGLDMCGDVQEPVMKILTIRGWNLRFPRPVLCGKLVADVHLMHVSGAWLMLRYRETCQAGLVGCYTVNDDVACDCGCCSRK